MRSDHCWSHGPRQAQRLVPRRQLDGPRPRVLREGDGEHLEDDALDVVLGLRLGEPERVDLHPVPEPALLVVLHAVALTGQLVPQPDEGPHLAHLLDEAHPGVDEEGDPGDDLAEPLLRHLSGVAHGVEDGDRRAHRVGDLLHRGRPGLLQVVAADVDRVPLRDVGDRVGHHVGDQPQRGRRREDVGPPRQVLLDDVVLGRAGQRAHRGDRVLTRLLGLLLGGHLVEREEPHRGGVDRHRGVHPRQRDVGEQGSHVAEVRDRDADLADLAAGERVVGVVPGLGRQVEGDRQPGLPLVEVAAVEGVARGRAAVPGVGAHHPRAVTLGRGRVAALGHASTLAAGTRRTRAR